MKKILALHTGGTISMSASNDKVKTNEKIRYWIPNLLTKILI